MSVLDSGRLAGPVHAREDSSHRLVPPQEPADCSVCSEVQAVLTPDGLAAGNRVEPYLRANDVGITAESLPRIFTGAG